MDHSFDEVSRFSDVAAEPMRNLPMLKGFENLPVVSLQEATQLLGLYVPEIESMVDVVQENTLNPADGLTVDESSSIALYTMEWSPKENFFHTLLNKMLRSVNRHALLPPWSLFLKLLLTAVSKLPPTGTCTVYRGVKLDLASQYQTGERIVWWGFSSCTTTIEALENDSCFGNNGKRTLFIIECDTGKNVRNHSFNQKEDEILLIPGREFEVVSSMDVGNELTEIRLKELEPEFPHIASFPSSLSSGEAIAKKIPIARIPTPVVRKEVQISNDEVQSIKVACNSHRYTDDDIAFMIESILEQQKCTELDLGWNKITHKGAASIAKALQNNIVRMYLVDLHVF